MSDRTCRDSMRPDNAHGWAFYDGDPEPWCNYCGIMLSEVTGIGGSPDE
jgi:hypothetical protein